MASEAFDSTVSLVRASQRGSREALEQLFTRYLPRVRQIVSLRLGYRLRDLADREDLVQDSLLNVFEKLDRFEETSEGTFRNWLACCVENSIRAHFRKAGAKKRGEGKVRPLGSFGREDLTATVFAGKTPSPSAIARGRELAEEIEGALLGLKEHQREVILLRRFCEMSYGEIAIAMGFSEEATARKVFSRALRKLEELLGIERD
jgi:RNA polymerase sigma-70 factor (subfamily 1)